MGFGTKAMMANVQGCGMLSIGTSLDDSGRGLVVIYGAGWIKGDMPRQGRPEERLQTAED